MSHSMRPDETWDELVASGFTGPLAVSAAQISVDVREGGSPTSLPSEVVLEKQHTLSAQAIVRPRVEDGPPAPSELETNVFTTTPRQAPSTTSFFVKREPRSTSDLQIAPGSSVPPHLGLDMSNRLTFDDTPAAQTMATFDGVDIETSHLVRSPLPRYQQAARPHSSSSSSILGPQVLSLSSSRTPTTNSQPVAPIPPILNSPIMDPSQLPTFNQFPNQSPDLEHRRPQRPPTMRSSTLKTVGTHSSQYTDMLIESVDSVSFWYTVLSCLLHWIILAGFLVLPATFDDLQKITVGSSAFGHALHAVQHVPFLVIGFTCCGIGALGLCILWWRWSHNYIWLLTSIFIPGMFSGLSGLISIFVNLYGPQASFTSADIVFNGTQNTCNSSQNASDGSQNTPSSSPKLTIGSVHYGATTIATIATAGGCAVICSFLTAIYSIRKHVVKRRHIRELQERSDNGGGIEKP